MAAKRDDLKQAGYVIPKHCGICVHSEGAVGNSHSHVVCGFHRQPVHAAGSCQAFDVNADLIRTTVHTDLEKYLDRRKFSRSNRHKQKVNY